MKKIFIFGGTGKIGNIAYKIIKNNKNLRLVGITYYKNKEMAIKISKSMKCKIFSLQYNFTEDILNQLKPDLVINAIPGFDGLKYTLMTITNKYKLGLANKESLVIAGKLITSIIKKNNLQIFPIDSEHFSINQLLKKYPKNIINKIRITASGSWFWNVSKKQLKNIKKEQVLSHPKWEMGDYININSATLMNKAFELIEAKWLFDFKKKQIEAIIHPNCYVHSMIELNDGSVIMHLFKPDMKIVIESFFDIKNNYDKKNKINFNKLKSLDFCEINDKKYPIIKIAYECFKSTYKAIILNSANEYYVDKFLSNNINFNDIIPLVINVFRKYKINEKINELDIKSINKLHNNVKEYCSSLRIDNEK